MCSFGLYLPESVIRFGTGFGLQPLFYPLLPIRLTIRLNVPSQKWINPVWHRFSKSGAKPDNTFREFRIYVVLGPVDGGGIHIYVVSGPVIGGGIHIYVVWGALLGAAEARRPTAV
jgi:hypothetical protein